MRARLVQIEGPGSPQRFRLRQQSTLIGRDDEADLCVPSERISRRHAVIRSVPDGHELGDLDSTNGTQLNGAPVHGFVALRPGDRIGLAEAAVLTYERRGSPALILLLVLGLAVGAAYAGWRWWGEGTDPTLDHATVLAKGAVASWRRGDEDAARRGLQAAAGVLYTAGFLDGVPRGRLMPEAFALIQAELVEPVDLDAILRRSLEAQAAEIETRHRQHEERQRAEGERGQRELQVAEQSCELEQVGADRLDHCIQEWLRRVLVGLRQDPDEIPPDFHRVVAARMQQEHGFIARSLKRGEEVVPMLREELERSRMPALLHYVALIESGYRPAAGSSAGAVGVWQFMPKTARHYGLEVSDEVDDRTDTRKATTAAARYLRDLVFEFGGNAMLLALASYNRGENAVRSALKRLDDPFSDRSYWRLVEEGLLPEETADYVPRFLAAAVAGEGGLPDPKVLAEAGY